MSPTGVGQVITAFGGSASCGPSGRALRWTAAVEPGGVETTAKPRRAVRRRPKWSLNQQQSVDQFLILNGKLRAVVGAVTCGVMSDTTCGTVNARSQTVLGLAIAAAFLVGLLLALVWVVLS